MTGPLSIETCSWETLVAELGDPVAGRPVPLADPRNEMARRTNQRPPVPARHRSGSTALSARVTEELPVSLPKGTAA